MWRCTGGLGPSTNGSRSTSTRVDRGWRRCASRRSGRSPRSSRLGRCHALWPLGADGRHREHRRHDRTWRGRLSGGRARQTQRPAAGAGPRDAVSGLDAAGRGDACGGGDRAKPGTCRPRRARPDRPDRRPMARSPALEAELERVRSRARRHPVRDTGLRDPRTRVLGARWSCTRRASSCWHGDPSRGVRACAPPWPDYEKHGTAGSDRWRRSTWPVHWPCGSVSCEALAVLDIRGAAADTEATVRAMTAHALIERTSGHPDRAEPLARAAADTGRVVRPRLVPGRSLARARRGAGCAGQGG